MNDEPRKLDVTSGLQDMSQTALPEQCDHNSKALTADALGSSEE